MLSWCTNLVKERKVQQLKTPIVSASLLLGLQFFSVTGWAYDRLEMLKPSFWFGGARTSQNYWKRDDANAAEIAALNGCGAGWCMSVNGPSFPCSGTKYRWGQPIDLCGTATITMTDRIPPTTSTQEVPISRIVNFYCPEGYFRSDGPDDAPYPYCLRNVKEPAPQMCSRQDRYGNPIAIATATKEQRDIDFAVPRSLLNLERRYSSREGAFFFSFDRVLLPPTTGDSSLDSDRSRGCKRLRVPAGADDCFEYLSSGGANGASYIGSAGQVQNFTLLDGSWNRAQTQGHESVARLADSWIVTDPIAGEQTAFDSRGFLTTIARPSGERLSVSYVAGTRRFDRISDAFGRQLQVIYNDQTQLESIVLPDAGVLRYLHAYDPPTGPYGGTSSVRGLVPSQVIYQDGTSIQYAWNEAALLGDNTYPPESRNLLTGVVDQLNVRFATYRFSNGRAVETQHAGGVDKWTVDDPRPIGGALNGNPVQVTDPLGSVFAVSFTAGGVSWKKTQPAGAGCSASIKQAGFNGNDNPSYKDDFGGGRTCYVYDAARNIEGVRVDGITTSTSCAAVVPNGSAIPTGGRKISTEWHPHWHFNTRVAEPGRLTSNVYNGQPDRFAGGAVASCAPTTALLPDGKPIAVLCKRVEQATTDTNGAAGFSAALQPGVPHRVTTWTYNQHGQVLTENGPRTDVNDTTTYAYYSDTSFTGEGAAAQGHYIGDLQTVTNAAGRVTRYTKYNRHGQVLESIDPNGVVTTNSYDLRQRLLSTTVGGQTTSYRYDPVGQLKQVTLPDQSWIGYDYDDAHRQVAVYDHKGNRTDYVLDNAGNKTGENTRDPSGNLKRQLSRSIDALGRVQQTTGRE